MNLVKIFRSLTKASTLLIVSLVLLLVAACSSLEETSPVSQQSSMNAIVGSSASVPSKQGESENGAPVEAVVVDPAPEQLGEAVVADNPAPAQDPAQESVALPEVVEAAPAPVAEAVAEAELAPAPEQPPAQLMAEADLPPAEPRVGFSAPQFTLQTLGGETIQLSELRGQPVVINYWTSWCVPCQEELPAFQRIYQDYQQQGPVILSVNAIEQDSMDDVLATIDTHGMTYTVLLDEGEQFWNDYQVLFFPTTFFVDENGIIQEIVLGSTSEENFRAKIDTLLAGSY